MYRPRAHHVTAKENIPAFFRPGNQALLVPSHSTNPSAGDPQSMLPGMGEVRSSNGISSNGLLSGRAELGFISSLIMDRAKRMVQIQDTGSPNAPSRPIMSVSLAQAVDALPAAPRAAALTVRLSWAGNTLAAEREQVREMYRLRPVKNWGKLETYVTDFFGLNVKWLFMTLGRQPIVSIYSVAPYGGEIEAPAVSNAVKWEHVDTITRPGGIRPSRWIITKTKTPSPRYAVTLYRTVGGSRKHTREDQVVRSDDLASEAVAREYIRSYEVRAGDRAQIGRPRRVAFWNGILARGRDNVPSYTGSGWGRALALRSFPQAVDGMGAEASNASLPAWGVAALAIGAVAFLTNSRTRGHH